MEILHSIHGFDVLQELIEDKDISEIMVNGSDYIFIEKEGRIYPMISALSRNRSWKILCSRWFPNQ